MQATLQLLEKLASYIPQFEKENTAVSGKNAGWHIQHSFLALAGIVDAAKASDPQQYKWTFNPLRTIIFLRKSIPRGKGKAPDRSVPKDVITSSTLQDHYNIARQKLEEVNLLQAKNYFIHPYFGHLHLRHTKKMLLIHTKHHLKIVEDILKQ